MTIVEQKVRTWSSTSDLCPSVSVQRRIHRAPNSTRRQKDAEAIRAEIRQEVAQMKAETGRVPTLAAVLVGEDPASQVSAQ